MTTTVSRLAAKLQGAKPPVQYVVKPRPLNPPPRPVAGGAAGPKATSGVATSQAGAKANTPAKPKGVLQHRVMAPKAASWNVRATFAAGKAAPKVKILRPTPQSAAAKGW
mmetsp:Transcript_71373/g.189798  ORF Transcript_71373/g.189798 Transcript_71373/m.189798 type:complete len:110 (-) Transcript_71373:49-378(-)